MNLTFFPIYIVWLIFAVSEASILAFKRRGDGRLCCGHSQADIASGIPQISKIKVNVDMPASRAPITNIVVLGISESWVRTFVDISALACCDPTILVLFWQKISLYCLREVRKRKTGKLKGTAGKLKSSIRMNWPHPLRNQPSPVPREYHSIADVLQLQHGHDEP